MVKHMPILPDPLADQEQQIAEKIALAKRAVAEKKKRQRQERLEQERAQKIKEYCEQVKERLRPLQQQLMESLEECAILGEEDQTYRALKAELDELQAKMDNPEPLAEQLYQEEIEREELLEQQREWEEYVLAEERRMEEEVNRWRQELLEDLIQTIDDTHNYFEASDIAIYIRDFKEDLLAINALETVLSHLIERLNTLNTRDTKLELRHPIEGTLNRMVDFALNQRMQGTFLKINNGPSQLKQSHRRQANRPYEYEDVEGKVVVFGGHPRMQRNVARRLPNVNLVWFNQDEGVASMSERADVVKDADMVILVTAYTSHKVQKIAQASCEAHGLTLTFQNSTGIKPTLELISVELKKKRLVRRFEPDDEY